jgi:transcription elongation factor GreB
MSKAFTRESDDEPERPLLAPPPLPAGQKNYLTPGGARRFEAELRRLVEIERPRLTAAPDDRAEHRRQLQALDQRIQHLRSNLQSAVIVPAPPKPWDQVRFGATVTVKDSTHEESRYRIVGVGEMDVERGWVSWLSPIARTLLNAKLGQRVRFTFPSGEEQLEILSITYDADSADTDDVTR